MCRSHPLPLALLAVLLLAFGLTGVAGADDLAGVEVDAGGLTLQPKGSDFGLLLTVSGPEDILERSHFRRGEAPRFDVQGLPDGLYTWELREEAQLEPATRSALAAARESGDTSLVRRLRAEGSLPTGDRIQSGSFTILHGAVIEPGSAEAGDRDPVAADDAARTGAVEAAAEEALSNLSGEQFISGDLYVHNSACIGFDCPTSGGTFGSDTIRLSENNLRIHFEDTSVGSFPSTDWRLVANDSASGGANRFSIEDSTANRTPFTVEGSAPTNSLYVDAGGRVGLGTANPVVELHVVDGDSPTLRLDQDGSSGFQAQRWDIAGNETSFFVRDATNGSTLPFRIQPGAPSNGIFILNDGDVVLGGTSADADVRLQVNANTSSNFGGLRVKNTGTGNIQTQFAGNSWEWRQTFRSGDLIFDSQEDGANELTLTTGGVLTVTTLVETSDRNLKENFAPVTGSDVLDRLAALPIQRWNFKEDTTDTTHIGPMAQDFYAAFGVGADDRHIAATDAHGVALAAIQALYQRLEEREALLEKVLEQNQALAERVSALEAMEP
ncbi:MAG: tail fiber domain-containing protein [Acidobacteria bacterium]|nr:tail fiber domain-containing protein [Acidobacteriota bacterium]